MTIGFGGFKMKTSKWVLYYPLIVFLVFFAVEKVSMLDSVKRLTQRDPTFLYFEYKDELLDQLEQNYDEIHGNPSDDRKILVILGSSRLLYFDYPSFAQTYPNWELYNFSAPVTTPAYYAFILERIYERGIKPDYILLEADPFQFNAGSDAFLRSNLGYSFDFRFILSHFFMFTGDEVSYFLARNLFASFKYPPDPTDIRNRWNNPMNQRLMVFDMVDEFQRNNRGGGRSLIPREDWYERDFARLAGTAHRTIRWLYGNYQISKHQFDFLSLSLSMLETHNTPAILVRPQVSRPMERVLKEGEKTGPAMEKWEEMLKTTLERDFSGRFRYMDLGESERYYCNTFVDASHMSLDCYHPFMREVMRAYPSALESVRKSNP